VARVLVPVGAVALAFGGFAIAQAATDSGVDTPHDLAERGLDAANPPTDDDTSAAPATPSSASSAAPTESATFDTTDLPDGSTQTFLAGAAGTVTIGRSGATLTVVAVGANPGWTAEIEQASGPEVEVGFRNGTARIDLEAEFEDGAVRVRVRERTEPAADDNGADTDDDDVAPPASPTTPTTRVDNSGPGSLNSGPGSVSRAHDDEIEPEHEAEHEIDDHSGSSSSGSGSGGSGSGHSGSDD